MPSTMETAQIDEFEKLKEFEEKGNAALRSGKLSEGMNWYMQGLCRARELNAREQAKTFSLLLITLM